MSPIPSPDAILAVRRIVACPDCGARRRSLSDSAQGVRAHCLGCGSELSSPFATERTPVVIGRGGQVLATT